MSVDDLIKRYKTQTRAAHELDYSQSQISNWKARGRIPDLQQLRIQHKTKHKLRADKGIV